MMPQPELTLEEAISLATRRLLPPGYKPEDYLLVGEAFPKRIAIMVALEAQHILFLDRQIQGYDPPMRNYFYRRFRLGKLC